jgi:hypothetical protein
MDGKFPAIGPLRVLGAISLLLERNFSPVDVEVFHHVDGREKMM